MTIAVYWRGGRHEVGVLSSKGSEVMPLAFPAARETGALALAEHLAAGHPMLEPVPSVFLSAVTPVR